MKEKQEVVAIKLEGQPQRKRVLFVKVGIKIKVEIHDIFIYNGARIFLVCGYPYTIFTLIICRKLFYVAFLCKR